jgi:hypothetical protein
MQRLLRTADWNADAVRDELRSSVVERLGAGGVLIADDLDHAADRSWWRRRRQAQARAAHHRSRGQAPP